MQIDRINDCGFCPSQDEEVRCPKESAIAQIILNQDIEKEPLDIGSLTNLIKQEVNIRGADLTVVFIAIILQLIQEESSEEVAETLMSSIKDEKLKPFSKNMIKTIASKLDSDDAFKMALMLAIPALQQEYLSDLG